MYSALEDIKLETVDYEWIANCTKPSHLKKAIKLIEQDGDYFQELKEACYKRLGEIDKSFKRITQSPITTQERTEALNQLLDWEAKIAPRPCADKTPFLQDSVANPTDDLEQYFKKQTDHEMNMRQAQRQRLKGNQALKSKDFDEAIQHYTRSVNIAPLMHQSWANRALVYLKKKQFEKCIFDCNQALRISPNYVKAFHRKAKAYIGMNKKVDAYSILQKAIQLEPENTELTVEMKDLRSQLTPEELTKIQGSKASEFKRITIQEDDADD